MKKLERIKRLSDMKKLERIKRLIEPLVAHRFNNRLHRVLKDNGFRKQTIRNGSVSGYIWVNKNINVVVKRNFIVSDNIKTDNRFFVPTIEVGNYRIQSRARCRGICESHENLLYSKMMNHGYTRCDLIDVCQKNIGFYKGSPKLFDW